MAESRSWAPVGVREGGFGVLEGVIGSLGAAFQGSAGFREALEAEWELEPDLSDHGSAQASGMASLQSC